MIEANDPFMWGLTSMSNTFIEFHNLHLFWMCIFICPYRVTAALANQAVGSYRYLEFYYLPRNKIANCGDIEAIPIYVVSHINVKHMYNVIHNRHMLWMCICICQYHVTAALARQAFGS